MTDEFPLTTMICMFHSPSYAQAAVKDLIALGLLESEIAVVGDARTELTGSTPTSTLQAMRVPEGDMSMLMDGLRDGGTIVAVRAPELLSSRIEEIFNSHSAAKVDDHVIETNSAYANGTDRFINPVASNFDTFERNRLDSFEPEDDLPEPDEAEREGAELEPVDPIDPLNRVD